MNVIIPIVVVAICVWGVTEIVRVGTRHHENLERIRHGYPTLDGSVKGADKPAEGTDYINMTESGRRPPGNN